MKKFAENLWEITYPMLIYYGISMVLSIGISMVLMFVLLISNPSFTDAQLETELMKYSLHLTFVAATITIPFFVLFKRRDEKKAEMNGALKKFERVAWPAYLLVVPFALFAMYSANMLVSILTLFMPDFMLKSYAGTETAIYDSSLWIQILAGGIMGPIVEEYLFRGLIYNRILRFAKPMMAGLISAALFGIFHWNWIQLPYAFLLGLALAFVYEKYKNIFAPILLHIVANMFSIIVTAATKNTSAEAVELPVNQQLMVYIPMFIVTAVIAIVLGILIDRNVEAKEKNYETIDSSNTML